jgi:hypothetical protein
MPKIITERDLIRTVADRWAEQYETGYYSTHKDKQDILARLRALDKETCSADDVNKIIGNKSWTRRHCSECREHTNWAIQVGEEPDYESATATLCRSCFDKAVKLVNDHDNK